MTSALTLVSLPIFPLHTVLFPGGALPLRVFEPRYRMMVRGCREQGAPFGVVTLLSGSEVQRSHAPEERFYPLGTLAHINMVATLSSGWELIHCAGQDRFRITTARQLANGLWVADVQLLPSDITTPIPADLQHAAAALRHVLHKLLQPHLDQATEQQFADCGWVANRWCELLPLTEQFQLQMLELDSPLLRLELITDVLEGAGIVPQHHIKT